MIALALLAIQGPAPGAPVYSGRARDLAVDAPRLDAQVTLDGALTEPVWRRAAVLTGFSQYRPVDGRPAVDSTEVLVWYAGDAIYFGVRAFEAHGDVRATLADRDNIDNDDYVQLLIDTFNDRRRAFVFGVNPLGVQADGIRTEGGGGGAGGPGAGGRFENVDMNPDFVFESHGRVTADGYEVEIRIPFKSVPFQSGDPQRWALNVVRKVQHSAYEDTWVPAVRANASFLAQSGTLEGLRDLHRGLVLDLNPFATGRALGAPDSLGAWAYDATPEVGLNVSWGVTANLSLDATVNPDFSQVEADVGQVTVNERFAVFFPEKRPFFLEGIEQFSTPNRLIHTRRIRNPIAGAKLTGKVGGTNIGLVSAVDDRDASATGDDYPVVNALRVRRDVGAGSSAGLTYTDRIDGGDFNRVGAADARLIFGRLYYFEAVAGGSVTRSDGSTAWGPIWQVTVDRTGRNWGFHYTVSGIHPDFDAATGFVNRTGIVSPRIANRITTYGAPGSTLENFTTFFTLDGTWAYDAFFAAHAPLETAAGARSSFQLKGGWELSVDPEWATVAFDSAFYAPYAVDRGADTVGFTVPGRLNGLWEFRLGVETPQFPTLSVDLGASIGRAAAFFEPAPANTFSADFTVDWRPTDQLRVEARYAYTRLTRDRDGTRLSTAHIPRLKIEYQLTRAVFLRVVGQYSAQSQDALRDPATDLPLLVEDDAGVPVRAAAQTANDVRVDGLFSYRPTPGTVVFVGYGASLTETDAFSFNRLRRVEDGFFVKVSYLFRP